MSEFLIYYLYDGEWNMKVGDSGARQCEWLSRNKYKMLSFLLTGVNPQSITHSEFFHLMFEFAPFEWKNYEVVVSYIPSSCNVGNPVYIETDIDVKHYLVDSCPLTKRRSILHVELLMKDVEGKKIKFENEIEIENEKYYFEKELENDYTSAPGRPGVVLSKPTSPPVSKASAPTPSKPNPPSSPHYYVDNENSMPDATTPYKSSPNPLSSPSPCVENVNAKPDASHYFEKVNSRRDATASFISTQCSYKVHSDPIHRSDFVDEASDQKSIGTFSFDDGLDLVIGQEFTSKEEVKDLVNNSALKLCFNVVVAKSNKKALAYKCKVPDCKWSIRAAITGRSPFFSLRTHNNIHTCRPTLLKRRERCSSGAVAGFLLNTFPCQLSAPPPKVIGEMMNKGGIDVSYYKARRGRNIARDSIRGDPGLSYEMLPRYLYMLEKVNEGTVTHLRKDANNIFQSLFFALGACIEGFASMRKVLVIDGTHLKTKYNGVLLVCTAEDGNKHQYPLAFGVVSKECDETWIWFLEKLRDVIPDSDDLVIISDRHASIKNAVQKVYPRSSHGYCTYHISQNLKNYVSTGRGLKQKKQAKDHIVTKFIVCAESYTEPEFERLFSDLETRQPVSNLKYHEYLKDTLAVKEHWARCYSNGARYNIMTTNGVESINAVLTTARSYPLILLLDEIVKLIITWFNKHRNEAAAGSLSQNLTPEVERTMHARKRQSTFFKTRVLNKCTGEYIVECGSETFFVDLQAKKCTCRVFDIDHIPCAHAISAYNGLGDDDALLNLISKYYLKQTWALAYVRTIYPVPSEPSEWIIPAEIEANVVEAPSCVEKRGAIRKLRYQSSGEKGKSHKKRVKDPSTF